MKQMKKYLIIAGGVTSLFLISCQKGNDASVDDSGVDTSSSSDTGTDTDADSGTDTISWTGCPSAENFPGDPAGTFHVEVTDKAVYCAASSESSTLKETYENKALLRVAPGSFTLTDGGGDHQGLPFCLRLGRNGEPIGAGVGQSTHEKFNNTDDSILHNYRLEQPIDAPAGATLRMFFYPELPQGEPLSLALTGAEDFRLYFSLLDPSRSNGAIEECQGEYCYWVQEFDSCTHASSQLNRHEVQLDIGSIALHLRIATDFVSGTEKSAFVRAEGELLGERFEQDDYFKLVYVPAHHHFVRHFAVLLDTPVDGACGVEIDGLEPLDFYSDEPEPPLLDYVQDEAFLVDCELNRIEDLAVLGYTLTVDP